MADSTTMTTTVPQAKDVVALLKPGITVMALVTAAGSMALAPTSIDPLRAIASLVGIAFAVAGAGALNMVLERDVDALMERTRDRPLPSGRMEPAFALVVGLVLSAACLPLLWAASNPLTVALAAFSQFAYVLVYTPMKQRSWLSLVVGAVPGAMPALMGYTAAAGTIDAVGLVLFGIVFLWQLPHFFAISIYREREYTRAGHEVLSAKHGVDVAKSFLAATAVPLVAVSFLLWPLGVAGTIYAVVAGILGVWFIALCAQGFVAEDAKTWSRRVFLGSLVWQTVLFAALAVDVVAARLFGA